MCGDEWSLSGIASDVELFFNSIASTHYIAIGFVVGMVIGLLMRVFPALIAQRNE